VPAARTLVKGRELGEELLGGTQPRRRRAEEGFRIAASAGVMVGFTIPRGASCVIGRKGLNCVRAAVLATLVAIGCLLLAATGASANVTSGRRLMPTSSVKLHQRLGSWLSGA